VSEAEDERAHGDEHEITPLELFFDLVFVFAITQVTILLADHPSWGGFLRGMLARAGGMIEPAAARRGPTPVVRQ
jgi:low temperature requirement protein LtrA